jgi:hypothetical protein
LVYVWRNCHIADGFSLFFMCFLLFVVRWKLGLF